jgi:hypothetical protein
MWILGIILVIVAIIPWVFSLAPIASGKFNWTLSNLLTAIVGPFFWSVLWGLFAAACFYVTKEKYNYKLTKVEGNISFIRMPGAGDAGGTVQLHVRRKKFEDIDLRLADVIDQGHEYAIYYLNDSPVGRKIISAGIRSVSMQLYYPLYTPPFYMRRGPPILRPSFKTSLYKLPGCYLLRLASAPSSRALA